MISSIVFTNKLKRNIWSKYNSIYYFNRPDIFKTAPSVQMVKVFDCWSVGRSTVKYLNEDDCSSLMKMIVPIENYLSHYLGYRSWLLCKLTQKGSSLNSSGHCHQRFERALSLWGPLVHLCTTSLINLYMYLMMTIMFMYWYYNIV